MTTLNFEIGEGANAHYRGYLAGSRSANRLLLVLQEIYGVNPEVRRVVDAYAAQGYAVLAPDLFSRVSPGAVFDYADRDAARDAIAGISPADIVADIRAAATRLKAWRGGAQQRIGIIAFGWSGQHALAAATDDLFAATALYYPGSLESRVATVSAARTPLQFHFSTVDFRTPAALRLQIQQALVGRKTDEIYLYDGVDHGFANPSRPEYARDAASIADTRTETFLARNL